MESMEEEFKTLLENKIVIDKLTHEKKILLSKDIFDKMITLHYN